MPEIHIAILFFTLPIPMYCRIRISLIVNFNNFFSKKISKVPITRKIDSRSKSKIFFSFYSYNNLLLFRVVEMCEDTLSIDSSHKVFLEREVSLSVVISDLSLVFMRFTEEKSLSTVTDVCGTVNNNCNTLWTDGKMSLSHSANTCLLYTSPSPRD